MSPMTMQTGNKGHGFANNLPLQMVLAAALIVIVIVLAWGYVW